MILGYNSNGFAHHRLADAVEILAGLGYGGLALTPDVHHLAPTAEAFAEESHALFLQLKAKRLRCVVETGARFLLDPRRKHRPTLIDADPAERNTRSEFLETCISLAADLDSQPVVSFWSGAAPPDADPKKTMTLLADECRALADVAAEAGVRLAFEPEPGMFLDTMDKFAELHGKVNHPAFGLTLDVGHVVCMNEGPVSGHIKAWAKWLWNVHLDDMKPGVHDHLLPGDGTVDFADVFAALKAIGFAGVASVELSRHSHDAVRTAERCFAAFHRQAT